VQWREPVIETLADRFAEIALTSVRAMRGKKVARFDALNLPPASELVALARRHFAAAPAGRDTLSAP
jgi:hypothetical protein